MTVHGPGLGRYYEDFVVGDVYRHPLGRTISEADNTWFTLLTMNTNQNHFNVRFAERAPVGRIIVNSGLTVAVVLGLSVIDVSQNASMNLGWDEIRLTHPVFVGDTVYAESIVLETRESASRPYAGIVACRTRGLNQDGEEIMSWRRSVMVYKRDAPHDKDHFPEARTGPMTI
ncbi:MaoC family dehydratase [Planomonospora sp. ID82291]|uniref:MaoC family dehydratase n=1 Tax=Planomonospora sp. ID82291 TaxID=2738136 RepID=UPI0018C41408|nr:MaoC family dehydratase [Planomonospora sp. ID82291]MBG0817155.1 MaoC family dehydratase [Planomonospora sp. ID82291]